jgi:UDP-2-acetamido-2-deoxy-ribo-hexuluronate aminotransferase
MNLPFIDLAAQQRRIREALDARIQAVLEHGQYIMGPEVAELEGRLASYVGVRHAIGCSSGTDALLMALMAQGVGAGDAIFTTPFTFIATAEVVGLLGATPVFVDIDPETYNLDPAQLELAVQALEKADPRIHLLPRSVSASPRSLFGVDQLATGNSEPATCNLQPATCSSPPATREPCGPSRLAVKGIIAVDLFGLPADYDRINAIAKDHGLFVIEDAAQSFGAQKGGKRAGAMAESACTSFFPAKPLGAYGDGGMCFTDDDGVAGILRSLRNHGQGHDKYDNVRLGINGRLDTLQAAILLAKFDIFREELDLRQQVADRYSELLGRIGMLRLPAIPEGCTSAWAQYSILAEDEELRKTAVSSLKEAGIPTAVHYPKPLHLQNAFSYLSYRWGDFPASEDLSRRIFSLPMHPYLRAEDQERIAQVLSGAC